MGAGMAGVELAARSPGAFIGALMALVRFSEAINRAVGHLTAWMTLGTVLACFASVYTRYALNVNFIWLQ